jgi:hypothetical protein
MRALLLAGIIALIVGFAAAPAAAQARAPAPPPPSAQAIETAAREIATLHGRRHALMAAHLDQPALPAAAQAEMAALAQSIRALEQPFDAHPDWFDARRQLRERARALLVAETGPTWNRLMLARFPTPERLRADYPDDLRYYAALITIGYQFTFGHTLRPPRTPELDARDAAYSKAMEQIEAQIKPPADDPRATRRFDQALHALTWSSQFKRETLARYLPLLASFIPDEPAQQAEPVGGARGFLHRPIWQLDDDDASDVPLGYGLLVAIGLLALIAPPWWIHRAVWRSPQRHNARPDASASTTPALGLPAELRYPELPGGMRPELQLDIGQIVDASTWSETHVSATTTSGTPYHPAQTNVRSYSVQKDRMWLRGFDGREQVWTSTGGVFVARAGHLVALVRARRRKGDADLAMAYNHNSGATYEPDWINEAHTHTLTVWLLALLLWVAPLVLAALWIAEQVSADSYGITPLFWTMSANLAVILLAWTFLVRWWVVRRRRRDWQQRYRGRVLELLQRFGTALERSSATPAASE